MIYRVDLAARAGLDLDLIFSDIQAETSVAADLWFRGLEDAVTSLEAHPARGKFTRENRRLRQLLYGERPHTYRIIYEIRTPERRVVVLHIRHGARDTFTAADLKQPASPPQT